MRRTRSARGSASPAARPLGARLAAREERKVVSVLFSTSSASRRRRTTPTPRTSARRSAPYHAAVRRRSSGTAGRSRSSSATPSWPCSARRWRTRTTPSGRCAPALRILDGDRGAERADPGSSSRSERRSTPARRSWRSARGPSAGEGIVTGDVVNTALAAPGGGAGRGRGRRRADDTARPSDLIAYEPLDPVDARRERRSRSAPGARSRREAGSASTPEQRTRDAVRRPRATSWRSSRDVRPGRARVARCSSSPSSASRGSARRRLVRGAPRRARRRGRSSSLAPGPMPALRRGDHVLGPRRDREGAGGHPRVGRRREAARAKLADGRRPAFPTSAERDVARGPARAARRRRGREAPRRAARSRSPPGAGSSRRSPRGARCVLVVEDLHWADDALLEFLEHLVDWCAPRAAAAAVHRPAGAVRAASGVGRGQAELRRRSRSRRCRREDARLPLRRCSSGAVLPAETQALLLDRAGGNPLYAEEFVRMLATEGPRRAAARTRSRTAVPGDGAGAHRRAARHAPGPSEGARSRTRRSSARCSGSGAVAAIGDRVADGAARLQRARPQGVRAARRASRRSRARSESRSGTRSSATSRTSRSPAAPRADKHVAAAAGSRRSQASAWRIMRGSSPTTTARLSSWPGRPARRSPRSRSAFGTRSS